MKILYIYGDDDYAVAHFEDWQCEDERHTHEYAYNKANKKTNKVWEFSDGCYATAIEFEGVVSKDFIDFIISKKDYDATKHSDWFVVEGLSRV